MWPDQEPDVITGNILTNQSDCKDTWGSDRSRPETLDIHGGCAADGNDYTYSTPNHTKHGNQDIPQHHGTYPLQQPPVRKLDLSQLCFSLNFYFLVFFHNFLLCFPLLTYSQSLILLSDHYPRHSRRRISKNSIQLLQEQV